MSTCRMVSAVMTVQQGFFQSFMYFHKCLVLSTFLSNLHRTVQYIAGILPTSLNISTCRHKFPVGIAYVQLSTEMRRKQALLLWTSSAMSQRVGFRIVKPKIWMSWIFVVGEWLFQQHVSQRNKRSLMGQTLQEGSPPTEENKGRACFRSMRCKYCNPRCAGCCSQVWMKVWFVALPPCDSH